MFSLLSWKKADLDCYTLKAKNTMHFLKDQSLS